MGNARGDSRNREANQLMSAQRGRNSNLENCGRMQPVQVRGNRSVSLNKARKTRNNIGVPSIQVQNCIELKNQNGNFFVIFILKVV
jgi:hypothetical protein